MDRQKLKGKMREKEITQEYIGKIICATQKTVSTKILKGDFWIKEAEAIAIELDLTINDFLEIFAPDFLKKRSSD